MTILAIDRYFVGEPNIVGIVTDDTLATITTPGYWAEPSIVASIAAIQNGSFAMTATDLVLMYYATNQIGIFQFNPVTNTFLDIATSSGGGEVTPQEVQQSAFNVGNDTGTADHYIVDLDPAVTTYTDGLLVAFNPANTSTATTPDININGVGVTPIRLNGGLSAMAAGDIMKDTICYLQYSFAMNAFVCLSPIVSYANAGDVVAGQRYWFSADSGSAANDYVADIPLIVDNYNNLNLDPMILSLRNIAHSNTGASTLTITGDGNPPFNILSPTGAALTGGEITAGNSYFFFFDGTNYLLLNPANGGGGGGVTAAQVQQSAFNFGIDSGTSTAYAVTLTPAISAYTDGLLVAFLPTNTNTSITPTLDVNGKGAKQIFAPTDGFVFVGLGDISTSSLCYVQYDATRNGFVLLDPPVSTTNAAQVLSGTNYWNAFDEGSAANDYVVTLDQFSAFAPLGLEPLFIVMTATTHSNTGASTMTITDDVLGPWQIVDPKGNALVGGEILLGKSYMFYFNQTAYVLLNPSSTTGVTAQQVQQAAFNTGTDSGAADAYAVALSPAISSYTDGLLVSFVPANSSTTIHPTLNINGVGAVDIWIVNGNSSKLAAGDIQAGLGAYFIYMGGIFILLNPCKSYANMAELVLGTDYWTSADSGVAANTYIATINNSLFYAGQSIDPLFVVLQNLANTNNAASTLLIQGSGSAPYDIVTSDNAPLVGGEMIAGRSYYLYLNQFSGKYVLLNPSVITSFITAPAASSASAITLGSAFQNTLGYDAVFVVYLSITAATAADIVLGVDNNNAPTTQTIMSGITVAAQDLVSVPIYIPNGYYCLLDTTGVITLTISGQIAMPV